MSGTAQFWRAERRVGRVVAAAHLHHSRASRVIGALLALARGGVRLGAWTVAVCAPLLALSSRVVAQGPVWASLTPPTPSGRLGAALAYDAARGVSVLFGGKAGSSLKLPETWTWDGTRWALRAVSGPVPAPRSGHAMVYDASRAVCVLFGGDTGSGAYNAETWEWDGTAWSLRASSGPSARAGHAMAYDAARGVVVLFGGYAGPVANPVSNGETWEWNGTSWTPRPAPGPTPRYAHALAYDAAHGTTVLFGGFAAGARNDETWVWDGQTWTQRVVPGPSSRSAHAMAYAPGLGVVLFGGGAASGTQAETWVWNGAAWAMSAAPGPAARTTHSMAYDAQRAQVVLFGGGAGTSGAVGDTWVFAGGVWAARAVYGPSARDLAGLAWDSAREVAVLFGGRTGSADRNAETWEWGPSGWTQRAVAGPSARWGHAMAYDAVRGTTVLFGGLTAAGRSAETWVWNGAEWSQRVVSGPSARTGHAMTFDSARGVVLLFGGQTGSSTYSGETWEWDGAVWTRRATAGPPARFEHAMSFDAGRGVAVICGGFPSDGTWEWNGSAWTHPAAAEPIQLSGLRRHSLVWDAARGVSVAFGGTPISGVAAVDSTFEWNGTAWTLGSAAPGPSVRNGQAMVFDASRQSTLLFGGFAEAFCTDTWGLGRPPSAAVEPAVSHVCPGGSANLSAAASGSGPLSYVWRRGPSADAVAGATAGTYTTLAGALGADVYTCEVVSPYGVATTASALVVYDAIDYTCDGVVNPDDLGQFIAEYYTEPALAGPGGYALACPGAAAPFDAGYRAAFTADGSPQCMPPFPDNLGDFITAYFGG